MKYYFKSNDIAEVFSEYPTLEVIYNEAVELHNVSGEIVDHAPLTPQQLIVFIVYAYWEKSEIAKEMSIHKRRQLALELIGIEIKTEKQVRERPALAAMIIGTNSFVNRAALHFCKLHNNIDWIELCRLQDLLDTIFLSTNEEAPEVEKGKQMTATELLLKKTQLEEKTTPLRVKIRALAMDIFSRDESLLNMAASHMILEKRRRIITPEHYAAAMLKAKGDPEKAFAN